MGKSKVLGDTRVEASAVDNVAANLRAFRWSCQNAPYTVGVSEEDLYTQGEKIFFEEHLEQLQKCERPWYLPVQLGGLGLRPTSGKLEGDHARVLHLYLNSGLQQRLQLQQQLSAPKARSPVLLAAMRRNTRVSTTVECPRESTLTAADDWLDPSLSCLPGDEKKARNNLNRVIRKAFRLYPQVDSIPWVEIPFLEVLQEYDSGIDLRTVHSCT
jgi:hypothetical protein